MNDPMRGHLRLHFQKDIITAFSPLLQKGFYVEITTGNLQSMLCKTCDLDPAALNARIQTVFLNGKPVDSMATATVQDGDCLALSAAMPGLVGATMRSGGVLAGFRHSISYRPEDTQSNERGGILLIKLFNLLIKEIGPRFLRQGILVGSNDLRTLLTSLSDLDRKACKNAEWNTQKIDADTLATRVWPEEPGFVRLEVTFG
jgi:hypothetical protein